jgi:hypothetical protein
MIEPDEKNVGMKEIEFFFVSKHFGMKTCTAS